jgi:hypothetical protein
MTPSAVPTSTVASAPVLQWCRMFAPCGTTSAPCLAIAVLMATSSSASASASASTFSRSRPAVAPGSAAAPSLISWMRAVAHIRFTAVGREASTSFFTPRSSSASAALHHTRTRGPNRKRPGVAGSPYW